jgi:hypothetical protein
MQECGARVNTHQLILHQKHGMPRSYWLLTQFTALTQGTMKTAVWERPEIMTCRRNKQWKHVWGNKGQLQTIKKTHTHTHTEQTLDENEF